MKLLCMTRIRSTIHKSAEYALGSCFTKIITTYTVNVSNLYMQNNSDVLQIVTLPTYY